MPFEETKEEEQSLGQKPKKIKGKKRRTCKRMATYVDA